MSSSGEVGAFDRIVGHDRPKAFLERIQSTSRIATGILFHGDRGRGKQMTALAFVQRLFCDRARGCGACPPCRRYVTDNHPDLRVLGLEDGKSRISIAQIRDLKEWFSRAPFEADRRAAIIDDAHLMTAEAQNSLLKLLEEPPGQGLLVLVSPEPGGLLETVHSRLQSLYFGPLNDDELLAILAREGWTDPAEARAALPLAGGSAARALAVLGDEHSRIVLESAERLFDLGTQPFAYAEFVCGGKTAGAAARESARAVLDAAAEMLSRRIAAEVALRVPEPAILMKSPRPALESLEAIQGLILDAASSVAANASPRTVLEALKIRLHREIGRSRRRTTDAGA